jgi:hypothetical protein
LEVKENGAYTLKKDDVYSLDTACIQNVSDLDTQNRLDKNRLDKNRLDKSSIQPEATSSSEPSPMQDIQIFISLPLISGNDFSIALPDLEKLKPLYPAVDVEQELRKMKGWLMANPKNRKTERGIMRFITGWLSREQDRARNMFSNKKGQRPGIDYLSHNYTKEQLDSVFVNPDEVDLDNIEV